MFHILGFYKFKKLTKLSILKKNFYQTLKLNDVKGTIIFSSEGVNGTISGKQKNLVIIGQVFLKNSMNYIMTQKIFSFCYYIVWKKTRI